MTMTTTKTSNDGCHRPSGSHRQGWVSNQDIKHYKTVIMLKNGKQVLTRRVASILKAMRKEGRDALEEFCRVKETLLQKINALGGEDRLTNPSRFKRCIKEETACKLENLIYMKDEIEKLLAYLVDKKLSSNSK